MIRRRFLEQSLGDKIRLNIPYLFVSFAIVAFFVISSISLLRTVDHQEQDMRLKSKVDSLTHAIEVVRDSAAEDQDSQIQSNALWWMHRCEQDATDARASADSAMQALVRGFRRQSRGYWCACDAPATTSAASRMRHDSTITLPADQVGGPSLY